MNDCCSACDKEERRRYRQRAPFDLDFFLSRRDLISWEIRFRDGFHPRFEIVYNVRIRDRSVS
ncbi:hypothetical protein TSAR_007448 [Trichomalopsis sarcophagae]|uniref:Uncharacterized protein n=1 Tax=Trichomalopsis sarcophagae TaxID=543379 RepID=A0A232FAT5_9HYME|nr:hypothetical protein TSAR_007448 [Trichomalopsis sarcophagae]